RPTTASIVCLNSPGTISRRRATDWGLLGTDRPTQYHPSARCGRNTPMSKTWFITGASRGFGRSWTEAALRRGDNVAATARDIATLNDLADKFGDAILPIALDVTDRAAAIAAV